jgi:TetR/AcrR family transcriptional repressor of lmrAB and yxaGH operons
MPVKKIEQREFLVRCWRVFHLKGYTDTSMQDLATATGLQKAGLYHHFPTKEVLMQRVIGFAMEEFRSYVLAVGMDDSLPPAEKLEKMLRRNKRLATINRRGCFFANIALETGQNGMFNNILYQALTEWSEGLAQVLQHLMPKEKAQEEAERLVMEYEGAILFYKITGDENHLEKFIQRSLYQITGQYTFKQKQLTTSH